MQQFFSFSQQDISLYQRLSTPSQFHKALQQKGFNINTIIELILQFYRYSTHHQFDCHQKLILLNLIINILQQLITITTKEQFVEMVGKEIERVGRRDGNFKKVFSQYELIDIRKLINEKVISYYQPFRVIFDQNKHFQLIADSKENIPIAKEQQLANGVSIDVENISFLKEFIGIRQPKQEKKDAKKK